jgi:transporter family protein
VAGFTPMLILMVANLAVPHAMKDVGLDIPPASLTVHWHMMAKAGIVCTSWVLAYFAMKHLPISLSTPIRSSGPMWTLFGAIVLFHEKPVLMQWLGMATVFFSYYAFSLMGRREGVVFHRSPWVLCMFLATMVGSMSTLYDKYLIQQLRYAPLLVQFWFSFYNVVFLGLFTAIVWWPKRASYTKLEWRWSVALIGLMLIAADFVYFNAVKDPDALIVILSILRRSSVVVSFTLGAAMFGDVNVGDKAWALAGVFAGVILIMLA